MYYGTTNCEILVTQLAKSSICKVFWQSAMDAHDTICMLPMPLHLTGWRHVFYFKPHTLDLFWLHFVTIVPSMFFASCGQLIHFLPLWWAFQNYKIPWSLIVIIDHFYHVCKGHTKLATNHWLRTLQGASMKMWCVMWLMWPMPGCPIRNAPDVMVTRSTSFKKVRVIPTADTINGWGRDYSVAYTTSVVWKMSVDSPVGFTHHFEITLPWAYLLTQVVFSGDDVRNLCSPSSGSA